MGTPAQDWSRFVGFYGCGPQGKPRRVVRVGAHAPEGKWRNRYPKENQWLDCPACEDHHPAQILWRCPNDDEDFEKSELFLNPNTSARDHRNITIWNTGGVREE